MKQNIPQKPRHFGARSPEFALLGFLYEQPTHGYSLHQQLISELGHVWHVSQSQTYSILKRLREQGDISATTLQQEKLPSRQLLHITPSGSRRFKQWLVLPSGKSVRSIRLEFITRLYFAQRLLPEKLPAMVKKEVVEVKAVLARLEKNKIDIPEEQIFNRLGVDLRIRQLQSVLSWLDECRKAFGSPPVARPVARQARRRDAAPAGSRRERSASSAKPVKAG